MARGALILLVVALAVPSPAAATFGAGSTPGFVTYPAPEDLPNVANAGEPSIGVNWRTDRVLMQAFSSTLNAVFDDHSDPAGVEWNDSENPTGTLNLDPIMFTDPVLGRTWGGGLQGPCGNIAFTDADGPPWKVVKPCSGSVDHQTIGAGPFADPEGANASYPHAVYYCAQFPIEDACTTSVDGGESWGPPVPVAGCTGLHGHVKVGPDGTTYLPAKRCTSPTGAQATGVGGGISTSNGQIWTSYTVDGAETPVRGFDPSVGITADNVVYQAWSRAGDYHPMISRSRDRGATWERTTDLSQTVGPALIASTFHAVVAGDADRVAVAYLGTQVGEVTPIASPFDTGFLGVWHLFVSYTYDGGQTWKTVRTTEDPVQRGCIWDQGGVNDCRNILDFMDAQMTRDGRVVVGYADGCTLDCALPEGTPAQSTSMYMTVARQSSGRGLLSEFDTKPAAPGAAPAPAAPARPRSRPKACFRHTELRRRVVVDGRCSTDADGSIRRYRWDWGDRTKLGRGPLARHTYRKRGRFRIRLTITDTSGLRARRSARVKVPAKPRKHQEFGEEDGH
jgi:hypothetical protein